jgi:hypothetical protein
MLSGQGDELADEESHSNESAVLLHSKVGHDKMFKNISAKKIDRAEGQVRPVHEKHDAEFHALRMRWVVVADAKGNHQLQMCWRAK